MAKATRVYSTPPTNMPVDQARRRLLTIAAGGAVAAAMPIAALAAAPAVDPAFALIAEKRAADVAHGMAIDAEEKAEEHGIGLDEASNLSWAACHAVRAIDWKLATTAPTTLAGVAAVLRFANEVEDAGLEWIGSEGWRYQFRATMAAAIETLLAGKAVQS